MVQKSKGTKKVGGLLCFAHSHLRTAHVTSCLCLSPEVFCENLENALEPFLIVPGLVKSGFL